MQRASAWMTRTAGLAANSEVRAAARSASSSTAVRLAALPARMRVRMPRPGPISSMRSWGDTSAAAMMRAAMRRSTRKFCASDFLAGA